MAVPWDIVITIVTNVITTVIDATSKSAQRSAGTDPLQFIFDKNGYNNVVDDALAVHRNFTVWSYELPEFTLKNVGGKDIVFTSGELISPALLRREGNVEFNVQDDLSTLKLPLNLGTMEYRSLYKVGKSKDTKNAQGTIRNTKVLINTSNNSSVGHQQVDSIQIVDPGEFVLNLYDATPEILKHQPEIKQRLQKKVIGWLQKVADGNVTAHRHDWLAG